MDILDFTYNNPDMPMKVFPKLIEKTSAALRADAPARDLIDSIKKKTNNVKLPGSRTLNAFHHNSTFMGLDCNGSVLPLTDDINVTHVYAYLHEKKKDGIIYVVEKEHVVDFVKFKDSIALQHAAEAAAAAANAAPRRGRKQAPTAGPPMTAFMTMKCKDEVPTGNLADAVDAAAVNYVNLADDVTAAAEVVEAQQEDSLEGLAGPAIGGTSLDEFIERRSDIQATIEATAAAGYAADKRARNNTNKKVVTASAAATATHAVASEGVTAPSPGPAATDAPASPPPSRRGKRVRK